MSSNEYNILSLAEPYPLLTPVPLTPLRVLCASVVLAIILFLGGGLVGGAGVSSAWAAPLPAGTTFVAPITHNAAPASLPCSFRVISGSTVAVAGAGTLTGARAIDISTTGTITIPQTISYNGETYTVTQIGDYAFGGGSAATSCANLSGVELPSSLTRIGSYAFAYNQKLAKLELPSQLGSIGTYAFYYCSGFSTLTIPSSVTSLESYAFSRASGLRTVTFAGNAPTVGIGVFAGGGVSIRQVIYMGTKIGATGIFNSDQAAPPVFFYKVTFYASQQQLGAGVVLGSALVAGGVRFIDIRSDLLAAYVYSGAVPAFPEQTDVWLFVGTTDLSSTLNNSCSAYAYLSHHYDLASGSFTIPDAAYTGDQITPQMNITDSLGIVPTYTVRYYRQHPLQEDTWVTTMDVLAPGTVRVVATGRGQYYGSLETTFTIRMQRGTSFLHSIPLELPSGMQTTVVCSFKLMSDNTSVMVTGAGSTAVPRATSGALTIPQTINVYGNIYTTTGIESNAFSQSTNNACASLTRLTLPSTIQQIQSGAFRSCTSLTRVVFEGSAAAITFGPYVFSGDNAIKEVVYHGKKETALALFPSNPTRYYTVTFYDREENLGDAAGLLGTAIVRDDVPLVLLPSMKTAAQGLYAGSVPAYPAWIRDDGSWFAPTWAYPEVNPDISRALQSTLTNSVRAYGYEMIDAYVVDDAVIVFGLADNAAFDYTGYPLHDPTSVTVYAFSGVKLEEGTHYTARYEREVSPGLWEETEDFINPGTLRLVITGKGNYSQPRIIPFKIVAKPAAVDTRFAAEIPLEQPDGTMTTVTCQFRVTSATVGALAVAVYSEGNAAARAVPANTTGKLIIPETVRFAGLDYTITAISPYAFGANNSTFACAYLTEVILPTTINTLGASAFSHASRIEKMVVPGSVTAMGIDILYSCVSLRSVTFEEGVTSLGYPLRGCTALTEVRLPSTLRYISPDSFGGCSSLEEIELPGALVSFASAFRNLTGLRSVTLGEGITEVSDDAFNGCKLLETVVLPSTITVIKAGAFAGTALSSFAIPASVSVVEEDAFLDCLSLETIIVAGDGHRMTIDSAFDGAPRLETVVYRDKAISDDHLVFPSAQTRYFTVTFFADYDALEAEEAVPLGRATLKQGTLLRTITSTAIPADVCYDGAVPAYPATGANLWEFEGRPPLNQPLNNSLYAVARQVDLSDLAEARTQFDDAYRHTGGPVNPLQNGTGLVVSAAGDVLEYDVDYTVLFQRLVDGVWTDVGEDGLKEPGRVQVAISATGADGYHGQMQSAYIIAQYMAGDAFSYLGADGHTLTYQVLRAADELVPGAVQVGVGGSAGQAVAANVTGVIEIPQTVYDPLVFSYETVAVGDHAFYRRMGMTGVVIPATVTRIGSYAFAYEAHVGDIATSALSTVIFDNNVANTAFGENVFVGCDRIRTIVYGDKKGSYSAFGTSAQNITRYYTARFYASKEKLETDELLARVVLKEGVTLYSPSASDFFGGIGSYPPSDQLPDLAPEFRWQYEPRALGIGQVLVDSLYVFARELSDVALMVDVPLVHNGMTSLVPCAFDVILDDNDQPTSLVRVGIGVDGQTAVDSTREGTLIIPATITVDGVSYTVSEIAPFAFGGSGELADACVLTGIELPATIERIGQAAFRGCALLSSVTYAEDSTLATIGAAAFASTAALGGMQLPQTLDAIEASAFEQSGLTFIELPRSLASLGMRAFDGCAALTEVVFGGAMSLNLPRLGSGAPQTPGTNGTNDAAGQKGAENTMALALVGDYVFANCPTLKRLVFDADASHLAVSSVAFANSAALETVVYGSKRNTITFADAQPQVYMTVSYFLSEEDRDACNRASYLCVRPGVKLSGTIVAGDIYAGAIPSLPAYHEWLYGTDANLPLNDSTNAVLDLLRYALDTSDIDGAFRLTFLINGEEGSERDGVLRVAFGDTVEVTVESQGAVRAARLQVLEADTEQIVAETTTNQLSFTMPAYALRFALSSALELEIYQQSPAGTLTHVDTLSLEQMRALATTAPVRYSAWGNTGEARITTAEDAVVLTNLFEQYGIVFEPGDSLVFEAAGGSYGRAVSYATLFAQERFYYADIAQDEPGSGVVARPVIALRTASRDMTASGPVGPAPGAAPEDASTMRDAYQLLYGQTADELHAHTDTASGFVARITKMTVLHGFAKLGDAAVSGVAASYVYTGAPIMPEPIIVDAEGNTLVKDLHYELSYRDAIDAGVGYVKVLGLANYRGELEIPFRIVRASILAGEVREETAARIALEAYPTGSNGVIIASSADFPDALAASGLAGMLNYPLVLSGKDALSHYARSVLEALSAGQNNFKVIIIGSTNALSQNVEDALAGMFTKTALTRLGGADRYATAQEILFYGSIVSGTNVSSWSSTVIVASGRTFPDALSISPYAASTHSPVVLTDGTTLSPAQIEDIRAGGFTRAVVVGGPPAVGEGVFTTLKTLIGGGNVIRLGGVDRYETSLIIARWEREVEGMNCDGAGIATGENFPDGLAGGALLGKSRSVLLLASPKNTSCFALLSENRDTVNLLRFLGGPPVVTPTMREAAIDALKWDRKVLE